MIPTLSIRRAAVVLLQVGLLQLAFLPPAAAAAGHLDTVFGEDGKVTTGFADDAEGREVVIQADRKIVVAGTARAPSGKQKFALARYNTRGGLDPTFGGDGKVTTGFAGGASASGIAIQADGRIVTAGGVFRPEGGFKFALARYMPNGGLDPTFDGDGKVTTEFGGTAFAHGVAIQADGRIVAAGSLFDPDEGISMFALARYDPSGGLDPTFGGDGRVTGFGGSEGSAFDMAIQADGKIVAAGWTCCPGGGFGFALARYLPDGALDPTFGGDGRVVTRFAGDAERDAQGLGVAIHPDGRIVAAGNVCCPGVKFALARYDPSGGLDPTFGGDGKVVTGFAGGASADGSAVAIQADGRIVAAGNVCCPGGAGARFALARYEPSGGLDDTFGGNGRVTTGFAGSASASGVAIQADGKIVAAGRVIGTEKQKFALARYLAA
jgi:uncharacterized delta-60 repeat protein